MRLKEFQNILSEQKIGAAVFISMGMDSNPNILYFSQYPGVGALIIPKEGKPSLLVPKMEMERAKDSFIRRVLPLEKKMLFESVAKEMGKGRMTVGVDGSSITMNMKNALQKAMKKIRLRDISQQALQLRSIKTKAEVGYLRTSCAHADAILKKTFSEFSEFKTESDVASFLQYQTFRRGLDVSFKPIVASGKNGSMPHYEPKNTPLNKGMCVIDFGVKNKGYCSDITRTIGIKSINKIEKEKYQMLNSVQKNSVASIKENTTCAKIYGDVIKDLGEDSPYFTHGLGHGVGVEIHELPNLTANSKDTIQNSMVFTSEPGIYYPGKFGIRIEDTLLFQKKPITLTTTTKELQILG